MSHFLQMPAWARFQQSLGRTVILNQDEGFSYLAIVEHGKLNSRLYCPYGPVITTPAGLTAAVKSLTREAHQRGCAFVRIEPLGAVTPEQLKQLGLSKQRSNQPEHTWRINVDRSFDEVLSGMTKTLRNLHRNYEKKGMTVVASSDPQDISHLVRLLGDVSHRTGIRAHDEHYFAAQADTLVATGDALIYLVHYQNEIIAAALIYIDQERWYYAHAAASTQHRNLQASSILVTQMIEDACNSTQTEVDLFGISPESEPDHPWAGFSKFKRTFGGSQHDFLGTWELPVRRFNYWIYSIARRLSGNRV